MHIKVAQRLRPFSHTPGTCCLIPHTTWEAKIYPAKIFFRDLASNKKEELDLPLKGPITRFTIVLDLEKEHIEVFGEAKQGYFHYFILIKENRLVLKFKKREEISLPFIPVHMQSMDRERLSLGIHKKQDWDLVQRRKMMAEIFPFWLRLSHIIPSGTVPERHWENFALMEKNVEKNEFVNHFELLFQTVFQGILSPRVKDENYLGILPEENIPSKVSSIGLIHEGAKKIRQLFFQEEGNILSILPKLPPEFHAGRLVYIQTEAGNRIDIEWAKKEIKKIDVFPKANGLVRLDLQKKIYSFRLRKNFHEKGKRYMRDDELELKENQPLYLDRFEH